MPEAKVNNIELAYETYGEGEPLVIAHGYTASMEMWDGQIGPFSERYRVVVYDMRGHGESEAPPSDDPGYTLDSYVDDQKALMDHLGIERAYVGGLSMGGMIAMRFALKHPDAVRALLLFDTTAAITTDAQQKQLEKNRGALEALARSQGVSAVMRNLYAQRAETMGVSGTDQLPGGVQRHIERLDRMSADGFIGAGRALFDQKSVLERLSHIAAPTLILVGDQDALRGPSEQMHERMPQARFVLIKGSTHGTCLWQPEHFTAATLDFLRDVEAGHPVAASEER